jgi:hypothetical protein
VGAGSVASAVAAVVVTVCEYGRPGITVAPLQLSLAGPPARGVVCGLGVSVAVGGGAVRVTVAETETLGVLVGVGGRTVAVGVGLPPEAWNVSWKVSVPPELV